MNQVMTPAQHLQRAIEILGGLRSAQQKLELKNYQTLQQWIKTRVPAEYCPTIERITNGQVLCGQLRPDIDWDYLRTARCEEREAA